MLAVTCWRCEEPGHGYTECHRPPAASRAERDKRNARHVERWQAGIISIEMKRKFIAAENKPFTRKGKAA